MHPMGDLRIRVSRSWSLGGALRSFPCLGIETHPMGGLRIWGRR